METALEVASMAAVETIFEFVVVGAAAGEDGEVGVDHLVEYYWKLGKPAWFLLL